MRVALFQPQPLKDLGQSAVAQLDFAVAEAAAEGAAILVAPEMYLTGYNIGADQCRAVAQPLDGPTVAAVGALCRRHGIAIATGLPELGDDGAVYNTAIFLDRNGQLLASYRKTHLYGDVDRSQFSAGAALCTPFEFEGWKIALAICYDIEFPETARTLARAGVELLLTPTANMAPYDSVPNRLVPARAQENTIFVAYANYVGSEPPFDYCGLSCICGPDGEDIARAGRGNELIVGEVSKQWLDEIRQQATHLADIRPELYR